MQCSNIATWANCHCGTARPPWWHEVLQALIGFWSPLQNLMSSWFVAKLPIGSGCKSCFAPPPKPCCFQHWGAIQTFCHREIWLSSRQFYLYSQSNPSKKNPWCLTWFCFGAEALTGSSSRNTMSLKPFHEFTPEICSPHFSFQNFYFHKISHPGDFDGPAMAERYL